MKKYLLIGAFIGFLIPFFFWGLYWIFDYIFGPEVLWLWPSAIWLMATDGQETSIFGLLIAAFSVAANILCYSLIACLLYGIRRMITMMKSL